jgi:hypothetical protein
MAHSSSNDDIVNHDGCKDHTNANNHPTNHHQTNHQNNDHHHNHDNHNHDDNDIIRQVTLDWLQRIVIGLSFCPFAEQPFRANQVFLHVVRGNDETFLLPQVLQHMIYHKTLSGTTLVVCPECHPLDFSAYCNVLAVIEEDLIPNYDLVGHVQVASFHPLYEFAGSGPYGIDNWTNRAPYPMFHILREADVTKAVDKLGGHEHATKVWQRNIDLLEYLQDKVGRRNVERYIQQQQLSQEQQQSRPDDDGRNTKESGQGGDDDDLTDQDLYQRVQQALQQFRILMAKKDPSL